MRKSLMLTIAAASLLSAASSALAAGTWVPINNPFGSSSVTLFGINSSDIVTGDYLDSSSLQHGFVGPFDGSNYKSFDDPDGTTQPRGISEKSWITGLDAGSAAQWERNPKGSLKAITQGGNEVVLGVVQGINKSGVFVGDYSNARGIGFAAIGKKYKYTTKIKRGYAGRAIDDAGDIGGWYYDSNGIQHGFLILNGTATRLDYPKASYTVVEGLSDKGIVTGQYQDASGVIHGFYYTISTMKFKDLTVPGSLLTQVWGISNHGVIAASSDIGSYVYCLHAKTCPTAGGVVNKHHIPGFKPAVQ
jgi:hypothetical protein